MVQTLVIGREEQKSGNCNAQENKYAKMDTKG